MEVGDRKYATTSVLVKDSTLIFKIKFKLTLEKMWSSKDALFSFSDSLFFFHFFLSCSILLIVLLVTCESSSSSFYPTMPPLMILKSISSNHYFKCWNCQCKNYRSCQACSYNHYHNVRFQKKKPINLVCWTPKKHKIMKVLSISKVDGLQNFLG